MSANLLTNLHRLASRQDENFVTEAFTHLLRHLAESQPTAAATLLRSLTDGRLLLTTEQMPGLTISTQVATEQGRPDIEIRAFDLLFYVEVKVESGLGDRQLERYLKELKGQFGPRITGLVLLTRYPEPLDAALASQIVVRRWYQVADWIDNELSSRNIADPVSRFIAGQFLDFLRGRGVTMERVGWELVGGVASLRNLLSMVREAATALNIPIYDKSMAWESAGFYLDAKNYQVRLFYDRPSILRFATFVLPIASDAAERAGMGRVETEPYSKTKICWVNELDLDSEGVHFFARNRSSQMQCIEQFLAECLAAIPKIRLEITP